MNESSGALCQSKAVGALLQHQQVRPGQQLCGGSGLLLGRPKCNAVRHLTPGNSYDNASNGNHSAVHWDLIQIQTPEYGGGEIWFDDVLIRKDGLFVLDELKCLNPENLLSKEE